MTLSFWQLLLKLAKWLAWAVIYLVGLTIFLVVMSATHRLLEPTLRPYATLIGLAAFFATNFVAIAIHELGHVVGAVCVGLRVQSVMIGPILVERQPWKLKFGWRVGSDIGGMVSLDPRELSSPKYKQLIITAAGPLANLVTAVAIFIVIDDMRNISVLAMFAVILAYISIFYFGVSLYPNSTESGFCSDGAFILSALFGWRPLTIGRDTLAWISDERPSKWAMQLDSSETGDSRPHDGSIYLHAVDKRDAREAQAALGRSLSTLSSPGWLRLEEAFLAAFFDNDPERARKILAEVGDVDRPSQLAFWRTEAAVRVSERDGTGALNALQQAWRFLEQVKPHNDADIRDVLTEIATKATALAPSPSP